MKAKNAIVGISAACAVGLVSTALLAAGAECPRWLSVMPLHDGCAEALAADAADLGNTTFIDGIAWSCGVNPESDPVSDKAAVFARRFRATAPLLRSRSSVGQGILLQSTMGHGGFPGSATPWQLTVGPDGTSSYRMCPMDGRFLDYIARTCRTFAELKPDFFMVDDDTRLVLGGVPGCFCPLHLAEFSKRTGREWTRQQVVAMLKKGASAEAEAWEALNVESLRNFFGVIRGNFGDEIPGMLCVVMDAPHIRHAGEFARVLAAPGQIPVVRGAGAPYHDMDLFHVVNMQSLYASQMARVGGDVVYMQESDTCPHTLWATSATRTFDHLVMLALEGCKGAKIWITRTGNYHERKSAEAYRRIFRENRGLMAWAAKTDFRKRGVVVPPCGPSGRNFADRYLALTGFPYRFGKAGRAEVTALTVETLAHLSKDEIREMLSGLAIVDGAAAIWLSRNGFSEDIGVAAKPWKLKTIQLHEFQDGRRQLGMRTDRLADLTETIGETRAVSRLFNRPRLDATPDYVAPGSVFHVNGRGGKVLALAQTLPGQNPSYTRAEMLSEGYKSAMAGWLKMLAGGMPGGVWYLGVGPVTCKAGTTPEGENVVVLNALGLDGDDSPELAFDAFPATVERLQGDGTWKAVPFERTAAGTCRVASPVRVQQPAIFRWN